MTRFEPADRIVLHVTNIPTPYRLPVYRVVRSTLREHGYDLHVFFLGKSGRDRSWTIPAEEFDGIPHTAAEPGASNPFDQVIDQIERLRPAAVVLAWAMNGLAYKLMVACRKRGVPCIVYTGETDRAVTFRRWYRLRNLYRRLFFYRADGFISYGLASTEYLVRRGVPRDRISIAINAVDTEFFRSRVEEDRRSGRAGELRESFRQPSGGAYTCHLLSVGYLIPGKGLDTTLDILRELDRPDVLLHIVGSGPEEEMLRERASANGLAERVIFHGYKQKADLPLYYAMADLLLFPSLIDVFGLVMVEGAAAALPIIASSWSGGTIDIVEPGVNGYAFDPRAPAEYMEALRTLISSPQLRRSMGEASKLKAISHLTPKRSAEGYVEGVLRVVDPVSSSKPIHER